MFLFTFLYISVLTADVTTDYAHDSSYRDQSHEFIIQYTSDIHDLSRMMILMTCPIFTMHLVPSFFIQTSRRVTPSTHIPPLSVTPYFIIREFPPRSHRK